MKAKDITSIYIKPSRRKCSISDFKCFDLYDQNMTKIPMKDCDVIDIEFWVSNKLIMVSMEVVDNKIHIWSHGNIKCDPLINTFRIRVGEDDN